METAHEGQYVAHLNMVLLKLQTNDPVWPGVGEKSSSISSQVTQIVTIAVFTKSDIFQNSPKSSQIFGLFKNTLKMSFWSYYLQLRF